MQAKVEFLQNENERLSGALVSAREEITRLSALVGTSSSNGVGTVTVVPGVNGSVQVNGVSLSSSSSSHAQPPSSHASASAASHHNTHSSRHPHPARSPQNGRPSESPTMGSSIAPISVNVSLPGGSGKALPAVASQQAIVANGRGYGY